MKYDAWFCSDCGQVRDLDCHARCVVCGSGSLIPSSARSHHRTAGMGSRIPLPEGRWMETARPGIVREMRRAARNRQMVEEYRRIA